MEKTKTYGVLLLLSMPALILCAMEKQCVEGKRRFITAAYMGNVAGVWEHILTDGDVNVIVPMNPQAIRTFSLDENTQMSYIRFTTALIEASKNRSLDVAGMLLRQGAKPDLVPTGERTALMHAAFGQHGEMITLLLEYGANPNLQGSRGETALMLAVSAAWMNYAPSLQPVSALICAKADLEIADENGRTALLIAADFEYVEQIELLLQAGANPDAKDHEGKTAADIANARHRPDIARIIRKKSIQNVLNSLCDDFTFWPSQFPKDLECLLILFITASEEKKLTIT